MKCLSLIQPFATLVIVGGKRYETRRWQTDFRGRLVIHASRRFPEAARELCRQEPFRTVLQAAGFFQSADLPIGGLLGSVELVECLRAPLVLQALQGDGQEVAFGDYRAGRWAWQLERPIALVSPIPFSGRLGLFEVPDLEDRAVPGSLSRYRKFS